MGLLAAYNHADLPPGCFATNSLMSYSFPWICHNSLRGIILAFSVDTSAVVSTAVVESARHMLAYSKSHWVSYSIVIVMNVQDEPAAVRTSTTDRSP